MRPDDIADAVRCTISRYLKLVFETKFNAQPQTSKAT